MTTESFTIALAIYVLVELTACLLAGAYAIRASFRYLHGTVGDVPELFGRGRRKRLSRQRNQELHSPTS